MICPTCRASNDAGPQCRRCRADLSLLFDLEAARSRLLAEAYRLANQGRWREASAAADTVDGLRSDLESQRLRAGCALLRRDFSTAWERYLRLPIVPAAAPQP